MKKLLFLVVVLVFTSCSREDEDVIEPIPDSGSNIPQGSLNSFFSNALISDNYSNIDRLSPITITEYDEANNRIKTSYLKLQDLLIPATGNQSWFITQGAEAGNVVEIESVDLISGWISLGQTITGNVNKNPGSKIEFFNPFVNYSIINDRPLFTPYPTRVNEGDFNYIQPGGIIEKSDGSYVLLTPVVFGAHVKRSIYYATSSDLENWTFHDQKILSTDMIPFAKVGGNVFSTDNPFKLDNGNFLVLLGVQLPNDNYASAYMIIDENLNIIQQPKQIQIPGWSGEAQNSFPLSVTKFNNQYRILFHKRNPSFIDREIHEVIATDLFQALDSNTSIISSTMIHKGTNSTGYLRGKADDASYIKFNSKLYIIIGSEEVFSNYLTSNNREYGIMNWVDNKWEHDTRSPLINNPVQLHNKYPEYNWAWEHLGGFVSPIIKNGSLYLYMAFGTDDPDYYISGIKVSL